MFMLCRCCGQVKGNNGYATNEGQPDICLSIMWSLSHASLDPDTSHPGSRAGQTSRCLGVRGKKGSDGFTFKGVGQIADQRIFGASFH